MATLKRHTGSAFEYIGLPTNVGMSPQTLGYAEITANQGSITTAVDLTGLSVNVVVPEGRRLRITGLALFQNTNVGARNIMRIVQDGAQIQQDEVSSSVANQSQLLHSAVVVSPAAGSHTYNLRALTTAGTTTMAAGAGQPAFILVEDITGSTLPYQPASVPVGQLAYAEIQTAQAGITSIVSIAGLSTNIAVPAGRVVKVTAHCMYQSTVAGDQARILINVDGTDVTFADVAIAATGRNYAVQAEHIFSPSAGAHTVSVRAIRSAGTGSLTFVGAAAAPAFILVEDITPTPAPSSGAPGSTLGYAEVTTDQNGIDAEVALTGLEVTVTVPAGRRLRISGKVQYRGTVNDDVGNLFVKESTTYLMTAAAKLKDLLGVTVPVDVVVTPSAGTHTYHLAGSNIGAGTQDLRATTANPSFILVEDITGSVWPAGSAVTAGMIASEPWTDYVPTNVNVTLGDGTQTARYFRIGRMVHVEYFLVFGATTAIPATPEFGLPVPARVGVPSRQILGAAWLFNGATQFNGIARLHSGSTVRLSTDAGTIATASPFASWVPGSEITFVLDYEAAS